MAKILKAENIQTDLLGSNGNSAFSLQRNSSSLLTLHTNDCVGVNTTSPSHLFEVRGSSFPKICITSDDQSIDTGATFRIDLKNASSSLFEAGTISVRHVASNQTAAAESSYMSFFTRNAGTVAERMRIGNTGSVGIGTTNPATRFHVAGGNIRLDDDYTLSWGGTANTILGNNASNFLRFTTNSTVRMVINNAGLVGIGTTNPARDLTVDNATTPEIGLYTSGTERVKFSTGGSAQSVLAIDIAGTERFRINSSGNVGIGTSSPACRLHLVAQDVQLRFTNGSSHVRHLSVVDADNSFRIARTGVADDVTINSSGNVGIGTTSPTAQVTIGKVVNSATLPSTSANHSISLYPPTTSGYYGGGISWSEGTNTAANICAVDDGASGALGLVLSTGNNSAIAERLRIDSSGQVGIGTVSPINKLHLYNGTASVGATQLELEGRSNGYGAGINFSSRTSDGGTLVAMAKITADGEASWNTTGTTQDAGLRFSTTQDGTLTERLRIDSSGNVGIGTTTAHKTLTVGSNDNTAYISAGGNNVNLTIASIGSSGSVIFKTGGTNGDASTTTERLRIDSSGNVRIGATSTVTNGGFSFEVGYNGTGISAALFGHSSAGANGNQYCIFAHNGNVVGSITQAGTTAVAYNTSSDYRLKTNLEPISNGIERVKQLPVYRFNWITDQSGNKVDGFVAHEAQAIVPESVTGEKDAVDSDGNPIHQGIDQSKIVPLLTAALKEAIAKIETLEAKVTALEAA